MPTYIWVKDPDTKHEFDVFEDSVLLRKELVTPVKPVLRPPSPVRRNTKYHIDLAGRSATRSQDASTESSEPADNPKENSDG